MHKRFSGDEEKELCELYAVGHSVAALAERYSTERMTVSRTLRRNGIAIRGNQRRPPRFLSDEDKDEIVRRYTAGDRVRDMAGDYNTHYQRISTVLRSRGVSIRPRSWKGGRVTSTNGYLLVMAEPGDAIAWAMANTLGYVLVHRLVMSRNLGRALFPYETVHHVNGDKTDNRIENLQLRIGPHGAGQALRCAKCGSHDIVPVELA